MSKPTQYELTQLFYLAKIADSALSDAQALAQVKSNWRKSAKQLRDTPDDRDFEMTTTEKNAADAQAATDKGIADTALLTTLQKELANETAPGGQNRPEVVASIQETIATLKAV